MNFKPSFTALSIIAIAISAPLIAATTRIGAVTISDPWARETAPSQSVGGGFMTISNGAAKADKLLGASSPVSAQVQLHTMTMTGGVMRMRQVKGGIVVPARGKLELKPGGFHVMFVGLKQQLKMGTKVPVTLRFQNAGRVTVQVSVHAAGAMGPMEAPHAGH